ncbi:MAG: cobyrinate a,c-diamide synthase [Magnetococcales bacterium]|nr:cobyrinate a,c-diamide synthase [Magnetococcales bacterium]
MGPLPGFIIAGTQSRSGKTTLTLAIMATLVREGVAVAPFKSGPDYLDPAWHQEVTGRPSYNLDTFMIGTEASRRLLIEKGREATAIVEGVMGLYDGREGVGGAGSTADLARVLGLPVLLVVPARGMAGSLVPLVTGFTQAARGFTIAGILANEVGSESHAARLRELLDAHALPPLVGWLPRQATLHLEERHLGLTLPGEQKAPAWELLARNLHLDRERLRACLRPPVALPPADADPAPRAEPPPAPSRLQGRTIAIARDQAFAFLYPANLDFLRESGARLHFFSPLAGDPLPEDCDAVWLPGGYPELHGKRLATSRTWPSLAAFVAAGGAVLAECGGMMALGSSLTDGAGRVWPMAGILPIRTHMTGRLAGLGYRLEAGGARGHEFHHSRRDPCDLPPAFSPDRGDGGVRWRNLRASYVHWYFPSAPASIGRWLDKGEADG